jgi:hypothetical protein
MAVTVGAYVALHTPLRIVLAHRLGLSSRGCYLCAHTVTGADVAHTVVAAVLVLAASAAAMGVAHRFDGEPYERPLIFGLSALALISVPAAMVAGLASLAGGSFLSPPAGPLVAAIPAALVAAVTLRGGFRTAMPRVRWPETPLLRIAIGAAAVLLGGSVLVSLLHPPTEGDALTYHAPIGVFLWSTGNLTTMLDRAPGQWVFFHPGTAELFYGLLRLLGGERVADLGQLPFAALGSAAAYAFTRRTGLGRGAGILAGCSFALIPMVALQVGTQANDLTAAALLMAAVALAAAPPRDWTLPRIATLGAALGLTAVTKLALLPGVGVLGLIALGVLLRGRRPAPATALAFAFLVVVAPWWIRNIIREANPIYPQALPVLGHGVNVGALGAFDFEYVPRRALWPLYPVLEPIDDRSGFGALFAVTAIPGLVACWQRGRRWPLALLLITFVISLPLWWEYTLHEPRFLLPYIGLAAALVPWSLVAVGRRWRGPACGVLAAGAVFSVVLSFDQAILPLARLPVTRAAFYDRLWAVDPAADRLPEQDGILQVTGYGNGRVDSASTYPLLGPHQRRHLVPLGASDIRDTRMIVEKMVANDVRYAYVTAVARSHATVLRLFSAPMFRLVHESTVVPGPLIGVRRHLFQPSRSATAEGAISRYLFLLAPKEQP